MDPRLRLQQVLAGQQFPAERWELIVVADLYGADALTKSELHALPAVRFRSLADVLHAVERVRKDALEREQSPPVGLTARPRPPRPRDRALSLNATSGASSAPTPLSRVSGPGG